jgi:hypothetical protein
VLLIGTALQSLQEVFWEGPKGRITNHENMNLRTSRKVYPL